jgi:hypothetical protein
MCFVRLYGSRQRYRPTLSNGTPLLVYILCFATDNILGTSVLFINNSVLELILLSQLMLRSVRVSHLQVLKAAPKVSLL